MTWEKHLERLQEACSWAGIQQGRSIMYVHLLREFWEERRRQREHLLALYESSIIITIFDLWQTRESDFPGLKAAIARAFKKGRLISQDEPLGRSGGQARNDLFVYTIAGQLLRGGADVLSVNGIARKGYISQSPADLELRWRDEVVNVECKRPQKREALSENAGEAYKQLTNPDRGGRPGLIAVDCSLFVRPLDSFLETNSAQEAWKFLTDRLEELLSTIQIASVPPQPILAGLLLHASAPAMTRQGTSSILSPIGEPFRYFRPDYISTWVGTENPRTSRPGLCKEVLEQMNKGYMFR